MSSPGHSRTRPDQSNNQGRGSPRGRGGLTLNGGRGGGIDSPTPSIADSKRSAASSHQPDSHSGRGGRVPDGGRGGGGWNAYGGHGGGRNSPQTSVVTKKTGGETRESG